MMKLQHFFLLIAFLLVTTVGFSQGADCANADPFCTGTTEIFPAGVGVTDAMTAEPGNNYGCLGSAPNPAWYYMEIDSGGDLEITMSNSNNLDIDFALWGPFPDYPTAMGNCGGLGAPIDCSYSTTATEVSYIATANPGDVYILLVTNYSNSPTDIEFTNTGGTATTDCSIVYPCTMLSLTATPSACDLITNLYSVSGTLTFTDQPTTGTLTISSSCGGTPDVYSAPFTSPVNYTVTGINSDGAPCTITATFSDDVTCTISQAYIAPANCTCVITATEAFTNETCLGDNDGTITLTGSGGTAPYTYDIGFGPTNTTGVFTGLPPGTYNYTITGSGSCAQATGTITIAPGPVCCSLTTTTVDVDPTCNGLCDGSITVNTVGGTSPYQYSLDGGITFQASNVFAGLCAGTYDIYIEDAGTGGGGGIQTIWTEDFDATPCTSGCDPSSVGWTNNATVGANGATANTWYVSCAENGNAAGACGSGCGADNSLHVGNVAGSTSAGFWCPSGDCGAAYDASAASEITNKRAESPTINCTGYNSITVDFNYIEYGEPGTDECDFWYFDGVVWTSINPLAVTPCCGGPCAAVGTQGQWTAITIALPASADNNPNVKIGYYWTNDGNGIGADPSFAVDDIVVSGTDITGGGGTCTDNVTVTLTDPPVLTISSTPTDANCGVCDGIIDIIAGGGDGGPYQYSIDNGVTFQAGNVFNSVCAGNYNLVVQDASGCQITGSVTVSVLNGPTIDALTYNDISCNGICDGDITITATGATQYSVDNGATFQASNAFTGLCAGTYDVLADDGTGCFAFTQVTLVEPPVLTINAVGTDALCAGSCDGSIDITGGGGTAPLQYSIDNGTSFQAGNVFNSICAGTYDLVIEDANGCQITSSVTINQPAPLTLSFSAFDALCNGACDGYAVCIPGGGTTPYTYTWSNGAPNLAQANGLCAGTYSLTVSDANGCTIDTLNFPVGEPAAVVITSVTTVNEQCFGDCQGSLTIVAPTATQYSIDNGATFQAGNVFTSLCAGTYDVVVEDVNGCQGTSSGTITSPPQVVADFSFGPQPTTVFDPTINFTNLSAGETTYSWDFGDGTGASTVPDPSYTYQGYSGSAYDVCLTVGNATGCTNQVCQTVIIGDEFLLYVPNSFTPNGDGINDYFLPVVAGEDVLNYEFMIFDRWGELIYHTDVSWLGWDGTYKGTLVQQDVYVWKIIARKEATNEEVEYIGHVTVLR